MGYAMFAQGKFDFAGGNIARPSLLKQLHRFWREGDTSLRDSGMEMAAFSKYALDHPHELSEPLKRNYSSSYRVFTIFHNAFKVPP